jgi:hypothetical protein
MRMMMRRPAEEYEDDAPIPPPSELVVLNINQVLSKNMIRRRRPKQAIRNYRVPAGVLRYTQLDKLHTPRGLRGAD